LNIKKSESLLDMIPEDMRREWLENQRRTLQNTNISWSSYHDCPFISKTMMAEYRSITETGWYVKIYQLMVSIASKAIKKKYPISVAEIVRLIQEIDSDTGGWYKNRKLDTEARRALEFVLSNHF